VKTEREYNPGQSPVYPLIQRDQMWTLADWGMWGMPPAPPTDLDRPGAYERMVPPPWVADRGQDDGERSQCDVPTWAVLCIALGSLIALGATALLALA
jgi:hypothetical protein